MHQRLIRWRKKGIWEKLLEIRIDEPDYEWLMIDAGHMPRGKGSQSGDVENKRGLNTKIHLALDANGMPVRFFVTSGTTADCTIAAQLPEGFQAEYPLADRGYDTDAIILRSCTDRLKSSD